MANRLYSIFPSINGTTDTYKVYIDDSSFAGTAVEVDLDDKGFVLRYDGDTKNPFGAVIGSSVSITLAVTDDTLTDIQSFANDLKTAAEGRFTIRIDYNNGAVDRLFWCGYVLQDLSGFEDSAPTYGFVVSGTDGIGRLRDTEYKVSDTVPIGLKTVLGHLLECLTKDTLSSLYFGGSDDFIATCVNWQDSRIGAPATGKCPTAYTRFAGRIFAEKENSDSNAYRFDSVLDVLKTICSHFAARLYFSNGVYRFEQINERSQDTFYERRFDKTGALTSSFASQGYDFTIDQATKHRMAGGVFGYLPALKSVTAIYPHDAGGNLLEGYSQQWHNGPGDKTIVLDNYILGGDDFLRISGKLNCNIYLGQPYTAEWRFKWGLRVQVGGTTLDGDSFNVWVGGNPTTTINPSVPTWNGTSEHYELSTTFAISDSINETIVFNFDTPAVPTGTSITVNVVELGGYALDGSSVVIQDNWWTLDEPSLRILDSLDPDTYFEQKRRYRIDNTNVGNSETITQEFRFGHAVSGWTDAKLETFNGSLWDITTGTWDRGTGTLDYEFAKLWANEVMAARTVPTAIWAGSILAKAMRAHSRLIFQADNTAWLMLRGEFYARESYWQGEWFNAGVNRNATTPGPTIKIGNGRTIPQPGGAFTPGIYSPATGSPQFHGPSNVALTALTTNIVSTAIPAGTVTSIPLRYPVKANSYLANDDIFIVNASTGEVVGFTVSATANAGDTSLSVTSTTITKAIPLGAQILYGPLNKYTGEGGDGMNLPDGAAGQILRHDGTAWTPYSGVTDGHVLTWDTTNGWQAEAPTVGGGGTVTSVGLSLPAIFSVSGSPVTTSGTLTGTLANQTANTIFAGPTTGAAAAPTFRALVADDIPSLDAGKITTGVFGVARGGTGLSALGSANQLIRVNAGGTALEYFTPAYLTANQTITLSGDVTGSGSTAITTTIANSAVTYAKIQNVTDARILGRSAGSVGVVQELTVAAPLTLSGGVLSSSASGTVTSVGLTMPAIFNTSGTPITTSGTITVSLITQTANTVWAGPDTGSPAAPGFRSLVAADIPNLDTAKITTGVFGITRGGTGLSALGSANQLIRVDATGTVLEYFTPAYLTANQTITLSGDVTGTGSTAITTTIAANAVTDAKFRQSGALSIVGRSANSTGNVADISAGVDGHVLRRSGTTLGFGEIATAGIANQAVTYAKIQNVTDARLLGRSAGSNGSMQEITIGTGLSLSGGVLSNTASGVTGTGVSGRIALWSGTSSLTSDDFPFLFNTTSNRMGIGAPTPSAYVHVGVPTGTTDEGIRIDGNLSGNLNNIFWNVNTINAGANTIVTVMTGGANGGDPILQLGVNGVTTWSVGLDNSDNDRFKISHSTAPGSNDRLSITTAGNVSIGTTNTAARVNIDGSGTTSATYGLQIRNSAASHVLCTRDDLRVGILTTSPTQELHVQGDVIARQYQNLSGETITVAYGTGAGTGPLTVLLGGGANFFRFHFTTGTGPVNNAVIFTITCPQPWNSVPVVTFSPNNAQTATDITKFYVEALTSTTFVIRANGQLLASTTYAFNFIVGGF